MKRVLKYPLVTEKSSALQSGANQYSFVVSLDATKDQIQKEVESLKKNIDVEEVRTAVVRGKIKRVGRSLGKRSNWKKAIVRLKAGQTLELFESA